MSTAPTPSAGLAGAANPPPSHSLSTVVDASSDAHLEELVAVHPRVVVNFFAEWAPPCVQMNSVFAALASTFSSAGSPSGPGTSSEPGPSEKADAPDAAKAPTLFVRVHAEQLPECAAAYRVATVPSFIFLYSGRVVCRVEGADPPLLASKAQWLRSAPAKQLEASALVEATKEEEILLFMKGTPDQPKCGFSRQIVELLRKSGVVYGHRDVLKDLWVREGLKKLHNWPTYPQLYARGRLIGGLDIVRELVDSNELVSELSRDDLSPGDHEESGPSTLKPSPDNSSIATGSERAIPSSTSAANGTSTQLPSISSTAAPPAENSNDFPSTPVHSQVTDSSQQRASETPEAVEQRLRSLVSRSPIMLFMKGQPDEPRCGFSKKIVAILREQNIQFDSFDILEDPLVRQGLKELFSWPTYPQLYSKGTLIGGLDIVQELVEAGALRDELGSVS